MTSKEILLNLIYPAVCTVAALLLPRLWNEQKRRSASTRQMLLDELQEPGYVEKKQRAMAVRFAIVLYAAGCYFLLSFGPLMMVLVARFAFGLCLLICGIGALADSAVINEYGMSLRKNALEEQQRREAKP